MRNSVKHFSKVKEYDANLFELNLIDRVGSEFADN